ncbi:MAG TPA: methylmalonyl-CoA epimerase [Chloroflexota bacterium]|nr:methylmalonyl-CoA epimerase [Chloroflexota bacterium]
MIKVLKIEHIGVAVKSRSESAAFFKLLGLKVEGEENVGTDLKVAMLGVGESEIELLEPANPDATVAKFIEKRGEGIHHLALTVEDLDGAVKELLAAGVRMIDKAPRPGAGGSMVAFVHPAAAKGVLIELVQSRK